ncbi:MAG: hypothetical protein Q4F88_03565 [Eubacteriales bacterium]|nr:hypothetical protein [Eubacteriales bacterium]
MNEKNKDKRIIVSPESLDNYFATTSPSVWLIFLSIFVLIVGCIIYSFFGSIETVVISEGIVENDGTVCCFLSESDFSMLKSNQSAIVEDVNAKIILLDSTPMSYDNIKEHLNNDAYSLYAVGVEKNNWYYHIELKTDKELEKGPVQVSITVERKKIISMLIN